MDYATYLPPFTGTKNNHWPEVLPHRGHREKGSCRTGGWEWFRSARLWCQTSLGAVKEDTKNEAPNMARFPKLLPGKLTNVPWKSMVGRCISYWNSPFFRGHVGFQGCTKMKSFFLLGGGVGFGKGKSNSKKNWVEHVGLVKYILMLFT